MDEVCIANINAAGRRRRMALGGVVIVGSVAADIFLLNFMAWPLAFLGLAPLYFGWLCVTQATENT